MFFIKPFFFHICTDMFQIPVQSDLKILHCHIVKFFFSIIPFCLLNLIEKLLAEKEKVNYLFDITPVGFY